MEKDFEIKMIVIDDLMELYDFVSVDYTIIYQIKIHNILSLSISLLCVCFKRNQMTSNSW